MKKLTLPVASTFYFPPESGNFLIPSRSIRAQSSSLCCARQLPTHSNSYPLWRVRPRPRTAGPRRQRPFPKAARAGCLTPLAPLPLRARLRADLLGQVLQIGILSQERSHVSNQGWSYRGSRGRAPPEARCTQVPLAERRDPAGSTSCAGAAWQTLLVRESRKPRPSICRNINSRFANPPASPGSNSIRSCFPFETPPVMPEGPASP